MKATSKSTFDPSDISVHLSLGFSVMSLSVCLSVCQSHILDLLSMIHFAMQGTTYCLATSSVHQLN